MDIDKLNKAAEEYAAFETEDYGDIDERTTAYDNCIYGFRRGVDWLMQQPISERLTEEEKEKINKLQGEIFKEIMDAHDADDWQSVAHYILDVMPRTFTSIFGSDLFK